MDLKQLSYIVAIADEQNLSKAADKLYISQPALSLCLSRLEETLGLKLFERQKAAMVITEAGKLYVDTARKMLEMKDELYQELGQLAGAKTSVLEIGIVPMTCGPMFTSVYPQYRKLNPNVTLQVSENSSRALIQLLNEKKIRLAVLTYLPACEEKNLSYHILKREPFYVGICAGHPRVKELDERLKKAQDSTALSAGAAPAGIPISLFHDLPFILSPRGTNRRRLEDNTFAAAGMTPQLSCEINSIPTIRRMVANGEGAAFFAEGFTVSNLTSDTPHTDPAPAKSAVRYFPIDPAPSWNISAAHLKTVKLAQHEKQFLRLAQEYFQTHISYL